PWMIVRPLDPCDLLMPTDHLRPDLHQLVLDDRRNLGERDGRRWRRRGDAGTRRPRAEPGRQALPQQQREAEAGPVGRPTVTERDPPKEFVAAHDGERRRDGWGAQRRFFSAGSKARSRLRRWTATPNRRRIWASRSGIERVGSSVRRSRTNAITAWSSLCAPCGPRLRGTKPGSPCALKAACA